MIGYSTPNISQMRVWRADLAFVAGLGAGVSALCTRTGGLLARAGLFGFGWTFALAGTDLRFFAGALAAFPLGGADFADFTGGFVARLRFALAFGADDLRFLAGAFVAFF